MAAEHPVKSYALNLDELKRVRDRGLHEGIGALIGFIPRPPETTVSSRLRDDLLTVADALPELIAGVEQGRALWAICQEYGIKHRPFCSMAESEAESTEPCDCGLVEKVVAAHKVNRAHSGSEEAPATK